MVFKFICELIKDDIGRPTGKSGALSVETQVLAALAYFASPSFQISVGDLLGISQMSANRSVLGVAKALESKAGLFIHFPRNETVGFILLNHC